MSKSHDRLRLMCREARLATIRRDAAPAIVTTALKMHRETIRADDGLLDAVVVAALNPLIRASLKMHAAEDGEEPARELQLALWPVEARSIIERIDRERVFVPSRDEFVELTPGSITPSELGEAGGYLIGKGEDCIRRGNALLALARVHKADAA